MKLIEFCKYLKKEKITLNEIKQIDLLMQDELKDSNKILVFTDGGCISNGKSNAKAGIGVFIANTGKAISQELNKSLVELDIKPANSTNQRAELTAILKAITLLLKMKIENNKKIILYSDSLYSINCITKWYKNWIKNDWKNSKHLPVLNQDIIKVIIEKLKLINITFIHVRGHIKRPRTDDVETIIKWYGNYKVDQLAIQSLC